jgi:hypothetical protein
VKKRSLSGDDCHTNIKGLDDNEKLEMAQRIVRNVPLNRFRICDDTTGTRQLKIEDMT